VTGALSWIRVPRRLVLGAILGAAATLLFTHLGQRYMWQDEAQTALISRTILDHGVPLGSDGKNFFSQELGAEYAAGYLWRWHTWLPFYLTAIAFRALGATTLAARLPFAAFGLATVWLTYAYALETWRSPRVALYAAGLLSVNVPFILLSRQCRYYAAAALFSLLGLHFYAALREGRRGSVVGIVIAATLLFHVHYIYCASLLATLLVHAAWRDRASLSRVFAACGVVTALASPWVLWFAGMKYAQQYGGHWFHAGTMLKNAGGFLSQLSVNTFPPLFLLAVAILLFLRRRLGSAVAAVPSARPRDYALNLLFVAVNLVVLVPTSPGWFYRYMTPLLPVLCVLLAKPLALAAEAHRLAPAGLSLLFVLAGPLPDYVYELTHAYHGPVEGLVRHLQAHGRAGETVATTYEDMPLKFYTDLRVIGGLTGEDLAPAHTAEWIVLRRNVICDKDQAVADDLRRSVDWRDYEPIELDAPDTKFDNREAMADLIAVQADEGHPFRTDTAAPRLIVYRRTR
jgi:4-amino-4-deoxy-L-arabinose transferase-like glycosyltransferase